MVFPKHNLSRMLARHSIDDAVFIFREIMDDNKQVLSSTLSSSGCTLCKI